MDQDTVGVKQLQSGFRFRNALICLVVCVLCVGVTVSYVAFIINTPPTDFPLHTVTMIEKGASLSSISTALHEQHIIGSSSLFKLLVLTMGASQQLRAGEYIFEVPQTTIEVIETLVSGSQSDTSVHLTIPEGSDVYDISGIIVRMFPQHTAAAFTAHAKKFEGYLFPETYFIPPTYTVDEIVSLMRDTFTKKVTPLADDIRISGRSLHDTVVLASLVEKEGKSEESMKIIAGILEKRITLGMPLQVDAPFAYILGKTSSELTTSDLKIDSPYNTYLHKGLPPDPICNPGLRALTAVLHPTVTPYLYYLSDTHGEFHYSKTFEEHKRNKKRYLL